jgi:hypothetical protein
VGHRPQVGLAVDCGGAMNRLRWWGICAALLTLMPRLGFVKSTLERERERERARAARESEREKSEREKERKHSAEVARDG